MPPLPTAVRSALAGAGRIRPSLLTVTARTIPSYTPSPATHTASFASRPSPSSSSSSSSFGIRAPSPDAHPLSYRDAAIPYRLVQLVDPVTNHLHPPQPLRAVLATYDGATHSLVLVNVNQEAPIVKLVNKEEERRKERESEDKAKIKKKLAIEEKEVQVSWQSAKGDLDHKLQLAKSLLERGDRVQVVFANRKRGDAVADHKRAEIIAGFNEALEPVGRKWKDDDRSKGLWVLYYNPLESTRNEVQHKVREMEDRKKKDKEEKKEARRRKEEERRAKAEARAAVAAEEAGQ